MRIIKSYFLVLLMFSGAAYAQPGSRVVYSSKYLRAPGFIADSSFKAPSDTTVNKTGFAVKGTTAYIGDGVKWTAITGGSSTPEWGTITGDLDAQTDLNAALLAKADTATWVDYSATSTVTGWSSTTVKQIRYIYLTPKTLLVSFDIVGTSNSSAVSFTLPNTALWEQSSSCRSQNNGTVDIGSFVVAASSSTVNFYRNAGTSAWTNSGAKYIKGQFILNVN